MGIFVPSVRLDAFLGNGWVTPGNRERARARGLLCGRRATIFCPPSHSPPCGLTHRVTHQRACYRVLPPIRASSSSMVAAPADHVGWGPKLAARPISTMCQQICNDF